MKPIEEQPPINPDTKEGNRIIYPLKKKLLKAHRELAFKLSRFREGDVLDVSLLNERITIVVVYMLLDSASLTDGKYQVRHYANRCDINGIIPRGNSELSDWSAIINEKTPILKNISGWRNEH